MKSSRCLSVSFCFDASHWAFEQSDRPSRKSHTKINMAEKRTSETSVPPESDHETKVFDSEDEGSTVLRN